MNNLKILFTGSSSFSGFWFVQSLIKAGFSPVLPFQKKLEEYEGVRKKRVEALTKIAETHFEVSFGTPQFFDLIHSYPAWDLFCHHAAQVTNYKSPSFDYLTAVQSNTLQGEKVLKELKAKGCRRLILTGSLFEGHEGIGSENLRAVSPYGLSKGLTSQVFEYLASLSEMSFSKFVIPTPFGPLDEPKFVDYLMKSWFKREKAEVYTPLYIRDHVPISLLSLAYLYLIKTPSITYFSPSLWVESNREFVKRAQNEIKKRTGLPCETLFFEQKEFFEPLVRFNRHPLDATHLEWNEKKSWDELVEYYQE